MLPGASSFLSPLPDLRNEARNLSETKRKMSWAASRPASVSPHTPIKTNHSQGLLKNQRVWGALAGGDQSDVQVFRQERLGLPHPPLSALPARMLYTPTLNPPIEQNLSVGLSWADIKVPQRRK